MSQDSQNSSEPILRPLIDAESQVDVNFQLERRQQKRPSQQDASGKLYYQLQVDKIAKKLFESAPAIILIVCFSILNLGVIYWSLNMRLPEINNNLMQLSEQVRLDSHLFNLTERWSESDLRKIEKNIEKAESKIFASYPMLANWLDEKKIYAQALGFSMQYRMGASTSVDVQNTYSLPVDIELKRNQSTDKAYSKILIFSRSIIDENRRLEILSVDVVANDRGIEHFDLSINVWVKDPNHIIKIGEGRLNEGRAEVDEFIQ